jgi:hypothetical protein
MTAWAWALKRRGRRVFSNYPLIDKRKKRTKEYFFFGAVSVSPRSPGTYGESWADGRLKTMADVLEQDNALLLLDEVHLWLPSHEWQEIGFEVRQYLSLQRKDGVDIFWSAQSDTRVFKQVRELTATLWHCQRYGPWASLKGVDPESREDFGKKVIWMGPDIWDLYDTAYKVGSATGEGQGYGKSARYAPGEPDAPELVGEEVNWLEQLAGKRLSLRCEQLGQVWYQPVDPVALGWDNATITQLLGSGRIHQT